MFAPLNACSIEPVDSEVTDSGSGHDIPDIADIIDGNDVLMGADSGETDVDRLDAIALPDNDDGSLVIGLLTDAVPDSGNGFSDLSDWTAETSSARNVVVRWKPFVGHVRVERIDPEAANWTELATVNGGKGRVMWEFDQPEVGPLWSLTAVEDHSIVGIQEFVLVKLDLDGTFLFRWDDELVHHDVEPLGDGRIVALTFDLFETPQGTVIGDAISILDPSTGNVDWHWQAIDHIAPPSEDEIEGGEQYLNFVGYDWTHGNAIHVSPDDGEVFLNLMKSQSIYKIEMDSGDIDWRLGKEGDFGDKTFGRCHFPTFLGDGKIMLMDNDAQSPSLHSRPMEIKYDEDKRTQQVKWTYEDDPSYYSPVGGAAIPRADKTILVSDAIGGRMYWVNREGDKLWELEMTGGMGMFKASPVNRLVFQGW